MEKTKLSFAWDNAFFEKKLSLLTNLQLGFVGAALMLMMMDLSKLFLLAPLVVGLILASWYKHHLESVKSEIEGLSVELAPKSLLITLPANQEEIRVLFREIESVSLHKENLVSIVSLYLKDDKSKVLIRGLTKPDEFLTELEQARKEKQD